jgi:hypothetical protein
LRRFNLVRNEDETGISGTGNVAQGLEFDDKHCVMRWLTDISSAGFYNSVEDLIAIHGHNGKTVVEWLDD